MKKQIQIIFYEFRLSQIGVSSQEAYLALTEFLQPYSFKRFKGSKYSSTEDKWSSHLQQRHFYTFLLIISYIPY